MKVAVATLISAMTLTACASVQAATPLDEMSLEDAPRWQMVDLVGLDDYLLEIYQSGTVKSSNKDRMSFPVDIQSTSFEEFSKVSAVLNIHGKTDFETEDTVHINLASCNAIMGHFDRIGDKFKYRIFAQSLASCERIATGNAGKLIALPTPMLVESYIISLLPKITDYTVSSDGQLLKLLDDADQVLGTFKRVDSAS